MKSKFEFECEIAFKFKFEHALSLFPGKEDIVDGNRKLILGLIWRLIQRYSTFGEVKKELEAFKESTFSDSQGKEVDPLKKHEILSPKDKLLDWIHNKIPSLEITNFTSDWNDGRAICELVNAFAPGIYE